MNIFYDCLFNVPQPNEYGGRIAYSLLHKLNQKYPITLSLIESQW